MRLYPSINSLCEQLLTETNQISPERQDTLKQLAAYINKKIGDGETPKLIVICTHNSRRSHLGQLWLAIAADYFQLPAIESYSGGTEATAFNPRAVEAFRAVGLKIDTTTHLPDNPMYALQWKDDMIPYQAFSKKYEQKPNPTKDFAAIMVCTDADQGCPIVFGCDFRLSLPYEDPKAFDGTDLEATKYRERLEDIGREMLFALSFVNKITLLTE